MFDKNSKPIRKQQKSLPPDKVNNVVFAEALATHLNVAASIVGKFPNGFGELTFNDPADPPNPFNGEMIKNILLDADTLLSCDTLTGKDPTATIEILYGALRKINEAFADSPYAVDTSSFGVKTMMTPVRQLNEVDYLMATPGVIPAKISPHTPVGPVVPDAYVLAQNYPNPFDPTTTIRFLLGEPGIVTLKIYNVLGEEVQTLLGNVEYEEGEDEVDSDARALASGVHSYRVSIKTLVGDDGSVGQVFTQVKKMVLMK